MMTGLGLTNPGTFAMTFNRTLARYAAGFREFVWPSYRPERHYMRGPGPACERVRHQHGPAVNGI